MSDLLTDQYNRDSERDEREESRASSATHHSHNETNKSTMSMLAPDHKSSQPGWKKANQRLGDYSNGYNGFDGSRGNKKDK